MPSNHLIFCHPLLLLPSVFPSIRVFSKESALESGRQSIGASASVLPMNIQHQFPLRLTDLISLQSKGLLRVFSSTMVQKHQFFSPQPPFSPTRTSIHDYWKNHSFDYTDFVGKVRSLLFNALSRCVIAFFKGQAFFFNSLLFLLVGG